MYLNHTATQTWYNTKSIAIQVQVQVRACNVSFAALCNKLLDLGQCMAACIQINYLYIMIKFEWKWGYYYCESIII